MCKKRVCLAAPPHLLASKSVSTGICTRSSGLICMAPQGGGGSDQAAQALQRSRWQLHAARCHLP